MKENNNEIKDLIVAKKSILKIIKEKLEYKKQEFIESKTNTKYFKTFLEVNKDSEFVKKLTEPIYINLDEEEEEAIYLLKEFDFEKEKVENSINNSNSLTSNNNDNDKKYSNEEYKEIYNKVKEGKFNLNELSESDTFKIFLMLQEELRLKEEYYNIEERKKEQLEIEQLNNEIKKIKEEIKKLESENN